MAAGKVITGYSLPYVAKYNVTDGVVSYTEAQKLARGVSVTVSPEGSEDNNFYADNILAETDAGRFTGGTTTLVVDGLFIAAERFVMGLPAAGEDGWTAYGDDQQVPHVGIGFIVRYMSDGVTSYTPYVLAKNAFKPIEIEANTQEAEIDWQTTSLEAATMRGDDSNHNWKYVGADFATEAEAEAALRAKLGVSEQSGGGGEEPADPAEPEG